jgi:hypothetical protein
MSFALETPSRIVIDGGRIWRNGIEITIQPSYLLLGQAIKMSRNHAVNCVFGLATGDLPNGLDGGAIYISSPRADFPIAYTEDRVMRISDNGLGNVWINGRAAYKTVARL